MKFYCYCREYFDTSKNIDNVSYYLIKTPTLKFSNKGEKVIEECFYYAVCPQCERDIVFIKRKALNSLGRKKTLMPETLIGLKAIEYLQKTEQNRINKTNELRYMSMPYSKNIDLSYFKALNDTTQRPRYVNETGYSGNKVESELILVR